MVDVTVKQQPVAWRGKHMHPINAGWVYVDGPNKPDVKFGGLAWLEPLDADSPSDLTARVAALEKVLWMAHEWFKQGGNECTDAEEYRADLIAAGVDV